LNVTTEGKAVQTNWPKEDHKLQLSNSTRKVEAELIGDYHRDTEITERKRLN
jgi:hypothetical protein